MKEQRIELQPTVDLPKPHFEQAIRSPEVQQPDRMSEIAGTVALEQGATGSMPAVSVADDQVNTSLGAVNPVNDTRADGTITSAAMAATMVADDIELIEKEWIIKAKVIVDRTRGDPYAQNQAINQVKADYLKNRYNKEIKLTES